MTFCLRHTFALKFPQLQSCIYSTAGRNGPLPTPPALHSLDSSSDMSAARGWIATFRSAAIPRELVDLSFSRSSGPGGQNVNKVNTKATARCPLSAPWIPPWARESLRQSPSYVSSTKSLLITSSVHRVQAQNVDDCLSKLHALVLMAAQSMVKTETSEAQKTRVKELQKIDDTRRKMQKSHRSQVKSLRSKKDWG